MMDHDEALDYGRAHDDHDDHDGDDHGGDEHDDGAMMT